MMASDEPAQRARVGLHAQVGLEEHSLRDQRQDERRTVGVGGQEGARDGHAQVTE